MDKSKKLIVYSVGDGEARALAFASNHLNDERVQRALMSWHIVKCKNCGQEMSLVDADYDESFAPIHKNCGGKRWIS